MREVKDELETIWEGSGRGPVLRYYQDMRLERPRKPTKNLRIAGLRAEI
jgi:hypothetical protein